MEWTQDEDALLLDMIEQHGKHWEVIAQNFDNKTRAACRSRYRRLRKLERRNSEQHAPLLQRIVYEKEKSADWRERIDLAARVKNVRDRDKPFVPIADVTIKSDRPIGILITSDWQLGGLGTDYPLWMSHMLEFLDFDNLYMLVNGDLISNTYMHKTLAAVWQQVMSPEEQALLVGGIAREMVDKHKILAITLSEEHDQKDERVTGRAGILDMLREAKVPLFDNRGTLVIRLGKMVYVVYCVHKSKYHSSFNQLHSNYREFQLNLPANIIVTSHTHAPAQGEMPWYPELKMLMDYLELPIRLGGEVMTLQTGTYETENPNSSRFYGRGAQPKLQIVILYPDHFEMKKCHSFEDARRIMSG